MPATILNCLFAFKAVWALIYCLILKIASKVSKLSIFSSLTKLATCLQNIWKVTVNWNIFLQFYSFVYVCWCNKYRNVGQVLCEVRGNPWLLLVWVCSRLSDGYVTVTVIFIVQTLQTQYFNELILCRTTAATAEQECIH